MMATNASGMSSTLHSVGVVCDCADVDTFRERGIED